MAQLLTLEQAGRLSREEFVDAFGGVFEHSPWVAERAWECRPFADLDDLRRAFEQTVTEAPLGRRLALIRSHPELAGRAASAGDLTAESAGEQASAGLDRLSAGEAATLRRLNAAYRERFGFPMVVAVREHTKASIFAQAEKRLANSRDQELKTALGEVFKIADQRLRALVADSSGGGETT